MGRVAFPLNEEAVLGSVIQTLVLSTSYANKLCYMVSEVGLLRSDFTCILGSALGDWGHLVNHLIWCAKVILRYGSPK